MFRLPASLSDTVIIIGRLHAFTAYTVTLAVWNDVGVGPFTPSFNVTTQEDGQFWDCVCWNVCIAYCDMYSMSIKSL